MTENPNKISEVLLLAVKMQQDTSDLQEQLEKLDLDTLIQLLNNDDQRKAFWINNYNAFYQILASTKKFGKKEIYKVKRINIGGEKFSLDDIEHGILRKFRYKYSLGLFPNLWTRGVIKKLAVDHLDYRIHFALNCGAKSCPPIAFYNSEKINAQLNLATQSFLEGETKFDDKNKTIHTTALFQWFKFDFGGEKGIRKIYQEQLNRDITDYKINYNPYSWETELGAFIE